MESSLAAAPDPDPTESWWRIFDPRQSLRARVVLAFGGGALAFVLLFGWAAGALLHRQLERTLGPSFENLAYQIGDKLDRSLYERTRALQFTASLVPFQAAGTPVAQRRSTLDALLDASPDCVWIGFADTNGTVLCAAPDLFEGSDASTLPWFRGGRRQTYLGGPHEFPELAHELPATGDEPNPRFLDLAVPVTDANGKPAGVLAAHLRWSWARDTASSVISEAARRAHLGATVYAANGEALLDASASRWTNPPPAPAVGDRPGLRGSLVEAPAGDTAYLTGFARSRGFRTFRGAGWLVTVRQPAADAFAPVQEVRRRIWQVGALFAGATVVLSWVFASRLARRMRAIAAAAGRIGAGDILALLPLAHGRDEFQTMCAALGEMVARLRRPNEKK